MSQQLHQALIEILAMGYYKNQHARSGSTDHGHEAAVAQRIDRAGFTEFKRDQFPKLTKSILKRWSETGDLTDLIAVTEELPLGSYILQPAGTQGFPDLLIRDFTDRFIAMECKSGKNGLCPMWNDSVPKPHAVYVLSSGLADATTVFLGRDVIGSATYELMNQQEKEITAVVKKYNSLMSDADQFQRGWIQKSRKQHFQGGGSTKTNYFTHRDRKNCEKNVMEFVKQ